uniref:Reverse transcriptase n=1 Tax=Solanum tuberosum TaxID=4113 RepID=M1BM57_SOLTU
MVWRLISNNWYSILVNGKSYGFFKSSRGLKQGDPLSPTLFIIAAEVLARGLNNLNDDVDFKGYGMPKWSPPINHLSYADDTILFCSGEIKSIRKMMGVLRRYENISGQMVNLNKSFFYLHDDTPLIVGMRLRRIAGIKQGSFPFIYLGCPVFYGRKRVSYFEELVKKVHSRLMMWQNKWLSYGGKYILIANVLQSMPIYLLSAMNPPKKVIEKLHKLFAGYFWSKTGGEQGKYWVAWEDMCFPRSEGGVGFRSIHDVAKALFCKLWWNFRTSTSLWSSFMWSKYCKKFHPLMVKSVGASHAWKKMIQVRDEIEHDIWWQIKAGEVSFWFDNWTKLGALYYIEEKGEIDDEIEVRELIEQGRWNIQRLRGMLSEEMVQFIVESFAPRIIEGEKDKTWWMGSSSDNFTVKSAFEGIRNKKDVNWW